MKLNNWYKFASIAICVLHICSCSQNAAEVGCSSEKNIEDTSAEYDVTTKKEMLDTSQTIIDEETVVEYEATTKSEISVTSTTAIDIEPESIDEIVGMDGVTVDSHNGQLGDLGTTFDTFTFYRESTGLIFNDDSYRNQKSEWKKAIPGDSFGSLTVSSVYAVYDPVYGQNTEDRSLGEYYAWDSRLMSFEGNVTLNGILYAEADEQAFWGKRLFFRPTARSLADNNFPTLRPISRCLPNDPCYKADTYDDTQDFYLGNIDNFSDIIDWSLYTDENNIIEVYAEVELSDIKISYDTATGASNIGEAILTNIISTDISTDR